jgi:hypothetical protein
VQALVVNPTTGYQESNSDSEYAFNSHRKQEFLRIAKEIIDHHEYPNVGDICRVIGITVRTFQNHVAQDEKFAEDWRELELHGEATCLSDMYALRKKNPMYMFGWLRARLPEKYDTTRQSQSIPDVSWIKKLGDAINSVNNATVIATEAVITSTQTQIDKPSDLK